MEENIYEKTIQDLESLKDSYIRVTEENRKLKEVISNLQQRNKYLEQLVYIDKSNDIKDNNKTKVLKNEKIF